ncbi:CHAT domain-containing protein [Algoriphagus sp.]|uniref:CHAT domain-containing protein n=1 Tax=Algoriphagus sp. TaxID=1872435 RepID=UPI003F70DB58
MIRFLVIFIFLCSFKQQAKALQQSTVDSTEYWYKSNLLDTTAVHLSRQKIDTEEARETFKSLASYFEKVKATDRLAYTYTQLGTSFHRQNKLDSADFYHAKANVVLDNHPSTNMRLVNMVRSTYAVVLAGKNEYNKSASFFLKSLNFLKENNQDNQNSGHIARTYNNVATVYKSINDNDQSLRYYDSCLVILRQDKAEMNTMIGEMVHSNIALIYSILGVHEEAINHLKQSETIRNNIPEQYTHIMDRFPLDLIFADVYSQRNHSPEDGRIALSYLKRNYDEFQKKYPDDPKLLEFYNEFTNAYLVAGDYDSALIFAEKAEKFQLAAYGEDRPHLADTYLKYAKIYKAKEDLPQQLVYRAKAIEQFEKSQDNIRDSYGLLLFDQAEYELSQHNPTAAEEQIQKATRVFLGIEGKPITYNPSFQELSGKDFLTDFFSRKGYLLTRFYEINQDQSYLDAALDSYILSIRQALKTKQGIYSLRSKSNIYASNYDLAQEAILVSNQLYDLTKSSEYLNKSILLSDFSKSLPLRESFFTASLDVTGIPQELLDKEYELKSKLLEFEAVGYQDSEQQSGDLTEEFYLVNPKNEAYFQTKADLEMLISSYKKDYPNYYAIKYGEVYGVENELLPTTLPLSISKSDHLLIQYQNFGSYYLAFYTFKGKSNYLKIQNTPALKKETQEFLSSIQSKTNDFKNHGYNLFEILLKPILDQFNADKVIIIPDGDLALLPFEAFLSEPAKPAHSLKDLPYLIKRYQISYHYSAFLLNKNRKKIKSGKEVKFLGIAPAYSGFQNEVRNASNEVTRATFASLPNNTAEVREIAEGFNSTILLATDALESRFKESAATADIIHLAAHSQINNTNPLISSLVMQEDEAEDGFLHSFELFNLQLTADLVTLSACNSGVGDYQKGEGIMSLARGFMYANISNILMSIWAVPDLSTKTLMIDFYNQIKKGDSYESAIRHSKLDYIATADENTAHPYYWGAFIYAGDVAEDRGRKGWWIVGAVLALALLSYYTIKRNRGFAIILLLTTASCGTEKELKTDTQKESESVAESILDLYGDSSWGVFTKKADSLQKLGLHTESVSYRDSALESYTDGVTEIRNYLQVKRNHSLALSYNYAAEGIPLLASAYQLMDSTNLPLDEKISLLNTYYHFLGYNGKWPEALPVAEKIHRTLITTDDPDPESLSSVLFDIAYIHNKIGNYPEAVEFYEQALDKQISFYGESHQEVGLTYNNLAFNYGLLGLSNKQYQTYQKAAKVWEEAEELDQSYLMTVYGNLINWNLRYGDLNEAEGLLAKIRELVVNKDENWGKKNQLISQKKDDPNLHLMLNYWNKHLHVLTQKGQLDEAISYRDSIASLVSSIDQSHIQEFLKYLVSSEEELAELHFLKGDFDGAISHYEKALKIKDSHGHSSLVADTYAKLSLIYLDKNNPAIAEKYIDSAMAVSRHKGEVIDYIIIAAKIANAKHDLKSAKHYGSKTLAMLTGSDSLSSSLQSIQLVDFGGRVHSNYISGLTIVGQTYLSLFDSTASYQDLETAKHLFQLAMAMLDSYYLGGAYTDALASLQSKIQLGLLECHLRSEHPEDEGALSQLLGLLENNRSSQDWKKFMKNARQTAILVPDSIQQKEDEHRKLIVHYKEQLLSLQKDSAETGQPDFLRSKLHHHEQELEILESTLEELTPQYLRLSQSNVKLSHVQEAIDKQTTLLRYLVTDSSSYLFEISKNKILLHSLGSTTKLRSLVSKTMDQLKSRDIAFYESSTELFASLFPDGIDSDFQRQLLIIPDDIVNYVPFEALTPNGKPAGFLVTQHDISYSGSLPLWLLQHGMEKNSTASFAAFAPHYSTTQEKELLRGNSAIDLPGAASEAIRISELLKGEIHQGDKLDKGFFLAKAKDYSILHLAMHAEVNDLEGEQSSFVFADDSRLHAYELYNMRLQADLATLSACNTGYGPIKKGEGVKSLATAFSYAGVPSLIMGLWQLPDQSSESLMVSFYQSLLEGNKKNTSLANAKREYLKANPDAELSHPFYWAGLVVSGNTNPIRHAGIPNWMIAIALLLIVGGIGISWRVRAKKTS